MNSISEARELKHRVNEALRELTGGAWDTHLPFEESSVKELFESLRILLNLAWRDLDAMIDEWEDAKGIDRPL